MVVALPPAPVPTRRRTLFVGTAFACAAMLSLFGGLIGLYIQVRNNAGGSTSDWIPSGVVVPEVVVNTMLITMFLTTITAQWAVHAGRRGNRRDAGVALGLTALLALAILNAQAFVFKNMNVPILNEDDGAFNVMFYAITGSFFAAVLAGLAMALLGAFRALGGRYRAEDTEALSANALYWYCLTGAFCFVWYFVYVVK